MHSYLWCGFNKLILNKCVAVPFRWYDRPAFVTMVTNLQFARKVDWLVGGQVCRCVYRFGGVEWAGRSFGRLV